MSDRYSPFSTFAPQPQPWGRSTTCTHVAPDSCPDCDGTRPWTSAHLPEAIPPCMRTDDEGNAA